MKELRHDSEEEAAPMLRRRRAAAPSESTVAAPVARSSIGEARGGDLLRYKMFCYNFLGGGVSQHTRSDGSGCDRFFDSDRPDDG